MVHRSGVAMRSPGLTLLRAASAGAVWVVQTKTAASAAAAAVPRARIGAGLIGRLFERGLFGFIQFLAWRAVLGGLRGWAPTPVVGRGAGLGCGTDSMSWAASVLERPGWQ